MIDMRDRDRDRGSTVSYPDRGEKAITMSCNEKSIIMKFVFAEPPRWLFHPVPVSENMEYYFAQRVERGEKGKRHSAPNQQAYTRFLFEPKIIEKMNLS